MRNLLFVYGSLLSAVRHPQGERLSREADLIGPAHVQARLFRVSWYPGIILSDVAADQVRGEIYRLRDPDASLRWLDAYEGITFGADSVAPADEYVRRIATVTDRQGQTLSAWVYLYQRDPAGLARVISGVWSG
jgi:gamma-glutamylcyclotransferase (GGCT)/AIG2-like uncharacterized protein YtfP